MSYQIVHTDGFHRDAILVSVSMAQQTRQAKEGERESHYVHWASKTYEDESVFMSDAHLGWQ